MESPERSPKRQRLSPPDEVESQSPKPSSTDSAYVSGPSSLSNGRISQTQASAGPAVEDKAPAGEWKSTKATSSAGGSYQDADVSAPAHRRTDHERQHSDMISTTHDLPFLCQKVYTRARPHPSQDLLALYRLQPLAATVARRDPVTGAKINKLRKSYEGKIKSQNLPGRNRPTSIEGELMGLMEWPEEGWYDQRVHDRRLEDSLDPVKGRLWRREDRETEDGTTKTKMERALTLNPGRLPRDEDERWRATLALDESTGIPAAMGNGGAAATAGGLASKQSGLKSGHAPGSFRGSSMLGGLSGSGAPTGMRASAPASPAVRSGAGSGSTTGGIERPDRSGKKRRYDDASFEGYGEQGWDDDGYSTSDGRGTIGRKKRREFHGSTSSSASTSAAAAAAAAAASSGGAAQLDQGGGAKHHGHFASSSSSSMVGVRSS